MVENLKILNLSQQNEEELFSIKTKLSYRKVFHRKLIGNRNGKKRDTYE